MSIREEMQVKLEPFEESDVPFHEDIRVGLETLEGTENMSIHEEIQVKLETFEETDMSILEEIKVKQEPFEDTDIYTLEEIRVKLEPLDETEIQPVSIIEVEENNVKKEVIDYTEQSLFPNITLNSEGTVNPENESQESSTTNYPYYNNKYRLIKKFPLQRHGFIPKTDSIPQYQQDRGVTVEQQEQQQFVPMSPQYHCVHCGSGFVRKSNLTNHLRREMCTQKHQTCSTCQKVFTSQESLDTHMLSHFSCDVCGQEFYDSNTLEVHKKDQHSKLNHQCLHPDCNKDFAMSNKVTSLSQSSGELKNSPMVRKRAKTDAERAREYRARKKALEEKQRLQLYEALLRHDEQKAGNSSTQIVKTLWRHKKVAKTSAERTRAYRERQKALKNATNQQLLMIDTTHSIFDDIIQLEEVSQ